MNSKPNSPAFSCMIAVVLSSFIITACNSAASGGTTVASSGGTHVWLDQPPNDAGLPLAPFVLKAHARDSAGVGVEKIVFLVNTIPLGGIVTDSTQPLVYAEFGWNPAQPGEYRIQAQASNRNGSAFSEIAIVCVGPSCVPTATTTQTKPSSTATFTPVRTETQFQTLTPAPPTRTLTQASPPTVTRTATPLPQATTPVPQAGCTGTPNISSFSASSTNITVGQSATLNWGSVTNADSVQIDPGVGGVGTPGSTIVSPSGTTTYILTAHCKGVPATRQVTINVGGAPPPLDTTPPSITNIAWSAKTVYYVSGCGPNSLNVTANVSDPSGIASVQINYRYVPNAGSPGGWNSPGMSPTGGSGYSFTINVGSQAYAAMSGTNGRVEFYITARDNPGNTATSGTSSADVLYCPP